MTSWINDSEKKCCDCFELFTRDNFNMLMSNVLSVIFDNLMMPGTGDVYSLRLQSCSSSSNQL